jgi:cyclophilin family peptidyl-prolyl cis-trans isomerase
MILGVLVSTTALLTASASPTGSTTAPTATAAKPAAVASPGPASTDARTVVVLKTNLGVIKLALDKDKAPQTVENFLQYMRAHHYDGTIFHRVIPGFMIQGGGLDKEMVERTQRAPVRNEARNGLRNRRGTVAMARLSAPHSATSQFFINLRNNDGLDFGVFPDGWGYAVFGEVVAGMDVVDKIAAVPTGSRGQFENVPRTPVVIESVTAEH